MQYLGSEALTIMSLMVRTMQFILHLPMLQIMMPANVLMLYQGLLPVVCWDMLDGIVNWETGGIFMMSEEETAPFPG